MTGRATLRVVVVDDEEPARSLLEEYVDGLAGCELVSSCADGFEAVRAVQELEPDLLVLDVQMPQLDGFDVLELLDDPPAIVFSTAYEEHAIRAFEVAAVDYLLKPFSAERFAAAVERVRERLERGGEPEHERLERPFADRPRERILVRDGARIHVVPSRRIDYVEAQDDYVEIHAGDSKRLKKETLTRLEHQLDPQRFVRVHRSYLLNLDRLERLEPYSSESRVAVLDDGTRIPVSRSGYARLRQLL